MDSSETDSQFGLIRPFERVHITETTSLRVTPFICCRQAS